ncbi:MAG: hypothetical protein ACR2ID_05185 [Chthoniobacterales bacterium]
MRWLTGGLMLVNVATTVALLLGILAGGLSPLIAAVAMLSGLAIAGFAWWTSADAVDPETRSERGNPFRHAWFWMVASLFGFFAFRAFCWLLYTDGNQLKVQSANNLGDLSLHLTYIRNFAIGVPLWPENPIHAFSNMRYPAGTDLFNALLLLLGMDVTHGLIWTGLLASAATFYALYRWGGSFTVAGFLCNGGVASVQILQTWHFLDYQGDKTIAWKNLPLSMFVTQRGLLYALPAGLLLLWHWRTKYFRRPGEENTDPSVQSPSTLLPFWVELSLYATLPLFHVHTFVALSLVAGFLFIAGHPAMRRHFALLAAAAFLPATFLVWSITDHFRASSVLKWNPGWVQRSDDFAAPFFQFWFVNFGILIPLVLALVGFCIWRAWKSGRRFRLQDHPALAFIVPAALLFLFACFVKTAPWAWDNIKLIIWAYLIVLPFLWRDLLARTQEAVRMGACLALFTSGFISLVGGLVAKENGYSIADRAELDAVGQAVRKLPPTARFTAWPTYNHPLLLQGRKVVLGYPGHLWTQGFDYASIENRLTALMQGVPGWRENARALGVRYLFWGREEKANYPRSTRPWEHEATPIATGAWGAIYDLGEAPSP